MEGGLRGLKGGSPRAEAVSPRGEDRVSPRVPRRTTEPIDEIDENADNTATSMPEQPEKTGGRKRGLTKGVQVMARTTRGSRIDGVFLQENSHAIVGPNQKLLNTEVGVVARMMAPIRKYYWTELTDEDKHPMFVKLESEFAFASATEEVRKALDKKLHKRFLNYKYTCHKHYKELEDPTKARLNPPEGVKQEDWEALCEHFESDRFKGRSTNNIQNKAKQQYAHTTGAKSHDQRVYEMEQKKLAAQAAQTEQVDDDQDAEDDEAVPVDIELYANTHKKASDGTWVSEELKANYVSPSAPLKLCT
ncbi:unnamed protein product [Linum trigynum]|uniref:Uncharacterized protein n=1 Tax=Linum trigynum TaxID=586398 RepID=A0AAV2FVA5_9ROSI